MKVAIVHFWLFHMRGGERVVEGLCELFPDADIYTHVYDARGVTPTISRHRVRTTFISRLPFARRLYKLYLPLMPLALRLLDLEGYDLIVSSEAGPAKGVRKARGAVHLCYCHTPMRYVWGMQDDYVAQVPRGLQWLARLILRAMRSWDIASARGVDQFVANSREVASRIQRIYGKTAEVVHPPVDVKRFAGTGSTSDGEAFYLVVGHLVGYKRVDLAVDACTRLGRRLIVIGTGEKAHDLKRRAGPTISFLGWQSDEVIAEHYARCSALLFPGLEDFGMVPVEAMAAGKPVIAYAKGGALETVEDGVTGTLFTEQTVECLSDAIIAFERHRDDFNADQLKRHAAKFSREEFLTRMRRIFDRLQQVPQVTGRRARTSSTPAT